MVIVISAGNEGTAAPPRSSSAAGFVDWLSMGSPASCKNALTAGASRSDRTSGGFSSLSYGNAWPNQFPDPLIASKRGDPQCLADFSSRGPCDDRRIKPDVVAPGTDIVSASSSQAPLSNFWDALAGNAAMPTWEAPAWQLPSSQAALPWFGRAHFDVIKAPHHGSDRNIKKTFFRKVTADRHILSANGRDGNPDLATLIWLVEAAKD